MKILWFTNTSSLYDNNNNNNSYNGGGWIESIEKIIRTRTDVNLGISFFHTDKCFKSKVGQTTYYPIPVNNSKLQKAKRFVLLNNDKKELGYFLRVINDFKPDLIHVFGSEQSFGLLSKHTKIPLIIHLQGILNPILNAYYAPGSSSFDIIKQNILKPLKLVLAFNGMKKFEYNIDRESVILSNCNFFIGRTEWDKNISNLYAPSSNYYYGSEVLRDSFYKAEPWQIKERPKLKIISTISKSPYKGFDLILKTAKLLTVFSGIDFEWNVYGITEYNFWENKLGINCSDVKINLNGVVDSNSLITSIQESDIFVHPSYIDNSPNSVCEAQIIGIPVIAANVGGLSTLIKNNDTGVLIPANDPFSLVKKIIDLKNDKEQSMKLSKNARNSALIRHDKVEISKALLNTYKTIIDAKSFN